MSQLLRFILTILVSLILTLTITIGVFFLMGYISIKNNDLRIPEDKNIVVIGNSQPETAINDCILVNWKNLSNFSFFLRDMVSPLDMVLSQNQHVDTVIVGMSVATVCRFPDSRYMSRGMPEIKNFVLDILSDRQLLELNLKNPEFVKLTLMNSPNLFLVDKPKLLGEYLPLEGTVLSKHHQELIEDIKKNPQNYISDTLNNKMQLDALRDIIDLCHRHGVTCILIDTPQIDTFRYYDEGSYREYLANLGRDITVADYHDFVLPDTTYVRDVTHLNKIGAQYFSEYIRDHGLETVPIHEYAKMSERSTWTDR